MIAQLTGRVEALTDTSCVLDVGGVGYLVHASARTLAMLPQPPAVARLIIETQVRPEAIQLYGFSEAVERDWFRMLNMVQGVGARVALAILSANSIQELADAVAAGDRNSLVRAQGVGSRLAARILAELKDKPACTPLPIQSLESGASQGAVVRDAQSALINLGYRRVDVQVALAQVLKSLNTAAPSFEVVVRETLKDLATRGN